MTFFKKMNCRNLIKNGSSLTNLTERASIVKNIKIFTIYVKKLLNYRIFIKNVNLHYYCQIFIIVTEHALIIVAIFCQNYLNLQYFLLKQFKNVSIFHGLIVIKLLNYQRLKKFCGMDFISYRDCPKAPNFGYISPRIQFSLGRIRRCLAIQPAGMKC